jgi:uncharacterized protein (DUF433 family)
MGYPGYSYCTLPPGRDTPEAIHEGFDVVPITDIYAVIAYYLGHRDELDAYLKHRQDEADRIRQEIEANDPPQ